jgi:hypothetical protein
MKSRVMKEKKKDPDGVFAAAKWRRGVGEN